MLAVGLCAYGMSGKVFHAPLITAEPGMRLAAVVERSGNQAKQDYPHITHYTAFEELLADPTIDVIVVNTPNAHHYGMARAALEAGKHVVVEKPFTLSLEEGDALIRLAREKNRVLSVFHNKRLESDHLMVQQVVASGELGRIVEVEWHYDRFRREITHKAWKENPQPGAGTWFDLGIHMVDSMLCLFGKPNAVYADMRSLRREGGATDYFTTTFYYEDMRVLLRSNTFVSEKGATVTVHGDDGSFLKFGQDVQEAQMAKGMNPAMEGWVNTSGDNIGVIHTQSAGRRIVDGPCGCYEQYYRNIVDAITHKALLQFLPEQSLLGVKLLLAAEKSAHEQRLITIA